MLHKIKTLLFILLLSLIFLRPNITYDYSILNPTKPSSTGVQNAYCQGATLAGGQCDVSGSSTTATNLASNVIDVISFVIGIIAVIEIIVSGFKFITSSGESGKLESAKKNLVYAIIGLIIASLAYFIIGQVLVSSNNVVQKANTTSSGG